MPIESSSYLQQASIFSDLSSLDSIRREGLNDEMGAIKKAAKEFEAFFLKMMLKSMRQASEVIGQDNMMSSHQEKMYTGMMDDQLAVDLVQKGSLGVAELMISQFQQKLGKTQGSEKSDHPGAIQPLQRQSFSRKTILNTNQEGSTDMSISTNGLGVENSVDKFKSKQFVEILENEKNVESVSSSIPVSENKPARVEPTKKSLFESAEEFVEKLLPYAKKAASKLNLDPKVLIAQAALETGWGKYVMHDESGKPGFNMFGIKASREWQGEAIEIDTLEVENSVVKKIKAQFRKYQGFAESFADYAEFLTKNSRYQKAVSATEKPEDFVNQLQRAGYATDPQYASKIMRIFSNEVLQKVDAGE